MTYTKVPNALIEAIPSMKGSEVAVCMAVCRQTLGYQRLWDKISITRFVKLTGMSNRSIIDAIEKAVADGWMIRKRDGDSYQYMIKGAEEILASEKTSHENVAETNLNATFVCEESSQGSVKSSQGGSVKTSHTKEINTLSNDSVAAQPQIPLAQKFRQLEDELRVAKNQAAKLVEIYVLLYGKEGTPGFGYMLKVANQIGGPGYMAQRLWELAARPPNGDIMAYLLAEHGGKKAKLSAAQRNGKAQEVDLQFLLDGSES